MSARRSFLIAIAIAGVGAGWAAAQDAAEDAAVTDLRGTVPLTEEAAAPPIRAARPAPW